MKSAANRYEPDLAQVLEALPDGVMVVGTDFTVRMVNAAFGTLSGVSRAKMLGKKCYEIFPCNFCRTKACPLTRISEGVERLQYEGDKHCVCGRKTPGLITASAYRRSDGTLEGMIEIVRDVTPLYESRERFRKAMGGVIQAMSLTIEKRDRYTAGHQRRVTKLCRAIAGELGFSWERIQGLRMAAAIHDLGKILVPSDILTKPGELSDHEQAILREHPQTAYDILKEIDFPWPLADTIYQHHERLDGSGYPRGLKGEGILLEARILAVADVFEAMSSPRPYRLAVGRKAALTELLANRGKLYDAAVVNACMQVLSGGKVDFGLKHRKVDRGARPDW